MKNRIKYLMIVVILSFVGCYNDKSSNSYAENEVIEIEGLAGTYSAESGIKVLTIPVSVKSNREGELQYLWIVQDPLEATHLASPDTIARTKDLSVKIFKEPKTFILIYKVKNLETGYEKIVTAKLNVTTLFTNGWFVLKDDRKNSDIDFFPLVSNDSYLPNGSQIVENVLFNMNDVNLKGLGRQIRFMYNFGIEESDGTFAMTKSIMATTEKDVIVAPIHNMKIVRGINNISYAPWTDIAPDLIYNTDVYMMMINKGNFYQIATGGEFNTGHFGESTILDEKNTPYKLSKYMIFDGNGILFDELSCSFLDIDKYGSLSFVRDDVTTQMKGSENNQECLFMGRRNKKRTTKLQADGYGVFKDKTTGEKVIAYFTSAKMATKFIIQVTKLKPEEVANRATLFTLSADEAFMYMVSDDGDVWSRNLVSNEEKVELDIPADETVTYIRHHAIDITDEYENQAFNLIAIASTKGSGDSMTYTVRFFEKNAGSLSNVPLFTVGGKGRVNDLVYVFADYDSAWAVN